MWRARNDSSSGRRPEDPAGPQNSHGSDATPSDLVAADLIAQAEHDIAAVPMLICGSERFALEVEKALARRLETMPEMNRATASTSLNNGWALIASDRAAACAVAEQCAPEHLELFVADPNSYASEIQSAGAVFIGQGSAEVFGDYGAGPNHTLPTGGAARFAAGLSVLHFLSARTWLRWTNPIF